MEYLSDKEIGYIIKRARMLRNLTQAELGERLGVQAAAVQKWESGKVTNIKRNILRDMAVELRVNPALLIGLPVQTDFLKQLSKTERIGMENFLKEYQTKHLKEGDDNYGNISKLSGNRRRPFWVRITTGWEINEETGKAKQLTSTLGYYASRKEAMIALAEYHQNPIDLTRKTLTFAEVWDIWTPPHFKKYPSSAAGLRSAYKRCAPLYDMQMADIKKVHMQDILDGMNHMSEESQGKVKSIFKNAFKYCIENDIVTKDYSQFLVITPPKKKKAAKEKFFTAEELGAVFGSQDFAVQFPTGKKSYAELRLADTVLIMLYTGMRIGELLGVKTEDVDLAQRIIHVRGTKTVYGEPRRLAHASRAPTYVRLYDGFLRRIVELSGAKKDRRPLEFERDRVVYAQGRYRPDRSNRQIASERCVTIQ